MADSIGASQPAVSAFESGKTNALSQDLIDAMADALGVERAQVALKPRRRRVPARPRLFHCTNPHCLSNLPTTEIDGALRFIPSMLRARAYALACPYCRRPMAHRCPHCKAPVAEGVFCTNPECKEPRVDPPDDVDELGDVREWAQVEAARRLRLRRAARATDHPAASSDPSREPEDPQGDPDAPST